MDFLKQTPHGVLEYKNFTLAAHHTTVFIIYVGEPLVFKTLTYSAWMYRITIKCGRTEKNKILNQYPRVPIHFI